MPDTDSPKGALEAVRALISAVTQFRLYPEHHPNVSGGLDLLARRLDAVLAPGGEWRIAVIGRRVAAGGVLLDERPEILAPLIESLKEAGVETIVFRRAPEPAELRRFVALLAKEPRSETDTLSRRLVDAGIRSIEAGRLALHDRPRERQDGGEALEEVGSDAREVYDEAVRFMHEVSFGVQEGRAISIREAEAFIQSMIHQLQADRSPFLILTNLKSHHPYTFTHIINVCILTLVQIEALGASPRVLRDFGLASMLHDVGKSVVPKEILSKPGNLTPEEFSVIQRHPQDGALILHRTPSIPDTALIVAFEHHMRYNLGGYPRVKRRRGLHPCSMMTNIADTYDAMRSRRSYQAEQPPERVAALLSERAGVDFHPHLVRAFLQIVGAYPPGTRVRLDSEEEALVVRINPGDPFRPVVRLLRDRNGDTIRRLEVVDLAEKDMVGGGFKRSILGSLTDGDGGRNGAAARGPARPAS